MILVTGAAGKTGRAIIRALAARGRGVRALVGRDEQGETVRGAGAIDVVSGDLGHAGVLERAVRATEAVYHICPNMHVDEVAIGRGVLAAMRAGGVQRLVYHSVLHPQTQAMPHHWKKLLVEEAILASNVTYTILQPASYMQNVLTAWTGITQEGVYTVPYALETRLGMVDLEDVAEAAATILTQPGHEGAIYELAGSEVLTQTEIAQILARVLGRPVRAERMSLEEWTRRAVASRLGAYQIETLLAMFRYYERHGFCGNPHALTWLLGRRPAMFEVFVRRTVDHGSS